MGFLSGILGTNNDFQANGSTLQSPVTAAQATQSLGSSQNALAQQQALVQALQQQNGLGNQSNVYNQLAGVANGTGPNPAQAQLAQATGTNVANQASLMAGQRGAGSNVGLAARNAGLQGANTQQQAAGQAATLQANQSLNALNSMGGIANQQASNQIGQTNATSQAAQGLYGTQLQGIQAQNQNQLGIQGINSGVAQSNQQTNAGLVGGVISGGAQAASMMAAQGGMITEAGVQGPSSYVGKHFKMMAKGGMSGQVPVILSPGERVISLPEAKAVAQGKADPMSAGGKVPGTPKVQHNSYANDVVPANLKEGSVVLPLDVMNSKDPSKAASEFVRKVLAKKGLSK